MDRCTVLHDITEIMLVSTLNSTKWKTVTDDKVHLIQKMIFVCKRIENIVGRGEYAGFLFLTIF